MKSWQRYYRPSCLAQLQLKQVREQMQHLAQSGSFPAVMLFAGPKGVGKTSTARIVAAMLNSKNNAAAIKSAYLSEQKTKSVALQDPDLSDPQIANIIQGNSYLVVEIDAASHRGIDDVRSLQEQIYLPPSMGQMMVYILDEVHMFTSEAFNALLKVLEEPPSHAIFILATTEIHKIPATIVSRCQVINFTKASQVELVEALKHIVACEKLQAQESALDKIAQCADGSFRDAVKYLQLVASRGKINLAHVDQTLGANQDEQLIALIKIVLQKDALALVKFFANLRAAGTQEKFFLSELVNFIYQQLLANVRGEKKLLLTQNQAHFLLKNLTVMPQASLLPFLNLELMLLEIFSKSKDK